MKTSTIKNAWEGSERCKNCAIRHIALFSDLSFADFDKIHYPIDEIELAPGAKLYGQGDEMPFVYTLRSGIIKLVQYLPAGEQRIVRLLFPGDLAGLESLNQKTSDHLAVTLDYARVCRIPRSVINTLNRDTPRLHDALMQRWQKALTEADNWITKLSTGNAKSRVARLLLLLESNSEDDSFFLPSREDMGAMLGVTTESASKVTAEFKRNKWLTLVSQNRACIDVQAINHSLS